MSDISFSAFGTLFRNTISAFASNTSATMITWITPIITAGLALYFLFMALNHLQGKSTQPITDTIFVCLKVSLIAYFALNAANFVSYVIEPVASLESLLISIIKTGVHGMPSNGDNAWAALDELWTQILVVGELIKQLIGKFGLGTLGPLLLSFFLLVAMFFCAGYFTFAAIGILLINEISVVLVLGFGPIYLSLLMFPVTRGWFDNWLKSLLTYVLTMVMTAAVIYLFCFIFDTNLKEIKDSVILNATAAVVLSRCLIPVVTFCVLLVAAATLVKIIPVMAAGLTGGQNMGAVGLGQMLSNMGSTAKTIMGAGLLGLGLAMGSDKLKGMGSSMLGRSALNQTGAMGVAAAGAAVGASMQIGKGIAETVGNGFKNIKGAVSGKNSASASSSVHKPAPGSAAAAFQYKSGENGAPGEEEIAAKNAEAAMHASPGDFKESGSFNHSGESFDSASSSFTSESSNSNHQNNSSENYSGFTGAPSSNNPLRSTPEEERTAQRNAAVASEFVRQGVGSGNIRSTSGSRDPSSDSSSNSSSGSASANTLKDNLPKGKDTTASSGRLSSTANEQKTEEKTEFGLPKSDFPNWSSESKSSTTDQTSKQSKEKKK